MLPCQLGLAQSLRGICHGLATFKSKINPLGQKKTPSPSICFVSDAIYPAKDVWFKSKLTALMGARKAK